VLSGTSDLVEVNNTTSSADFEIGTLQVHERRSSAAISETRLNSSSSLPQNDLESLILAGAAATPPIFIRVEEDNLEDPIHDTFFEQGSWKVRRRADKL